MTIALMKKIEKKPDNYGAFFYNALFYMPLNDWIKLFLRSYYCEIA